MQFSLPTSRDILIYIANDIKILRLIWYWPTAIYKTYISERLKIFQLWLTKALKTETYNDNSFQYFGQELFSKKFITYKIWCLSLEKL